MQSLMTRLLLGGGGGFSPSALFSSGEQGAWYDPSDFGTTGTGGVGTLFQDSAGTTPVTAVEQPVGLVLDKSKGLVLGSELVTNGDFSNGLTGWTQLSGIFTASGGRAVAANTDSIKRLSNTASSMVAGRWYKITWNQYAGAGTGATNWTIPGVWNGVDNFANGGNYINGEGEKTVYFLAPVSGQFYIYNFEQAVEYDNFSVKELAGNHAYQTTSASRPTLRARYNLLTYSQEIGGTNWTSFNGTPTINNLVAPDGTTTATLFTENTSNSQHAVYGTNMTLTAAVHTCSAYIKGGTRRYVSMRTENTASGYAWVTLDTQTGDVNSNAAVTSSSATPVGNGWYRVTVTFANTTVGAGNIVLSGSDIATAPGTAIVFGNTYTGTSGTFYVWGAQLTQTAVFPSNTYQRIAAATDYATGAAFPPYLFFDGVDDSLLTNSVDFSATDKMTVWAGVTKSSDAATGMLAELSAVASSNNGSFALYNVSGSGNYSSILQGTLTYTSTYTTFTAPITNVASLAYNIAGATGADEVSAKFNGVTTAPSSTSGTSAGTGNYGNYPLYIGRRNNATLPLNGNIYSLIIRGAQSTAAQISSTESWVAAKTPLGSL